MFFFLKHFIWLVHAFTGIHLIMLHACLDQDLDQVINEWKLPAADPWVLKSSSTSCTAERRKWRPRRQNLRSETWRQVSINSVMDMSVADYFWVTFFWHIIDLNFSHTEVCILYYQRCPQLCAITPAMPADDKHHVPDASWNWGW